MTWVKEMRSELFDLKTTVAMQGLANYIAFSFMKDDQDKIIEGLQDPTKTVHIEITVRDKVNNLSQTKGPSES